MGHSEIATCPETWFRRRLARLLFTVLGASLAAYGQPATTAKFEAASIKPAAPSGIRNYVMRGGPGTDSPGQLTCFSITLKMLILRAWDLRDYQLVGPSSLDSDKYDIVAKIPSGSTKDQVNLMVQDLLADRFGLVFHKETRKTSPSTK